jgi:hypothetical protein
MYRVILACYGVPASAGASAANDIETEFREHRTWQCNVSCNWDGGRLLLQADNDFDSNGLALMDEFSDAISAYIADGFDGEIKVESISVLEMDS